jgi:hypothetical protein
MYRFMNDTVYRLKVIGSSVLALIIIYLIGSCTAHIINYREYVPVTVQSYGWDTKIDVYQWMTVHEGDWYVPSGGRETDSYLKQSGTRKVKTGTIRSCSGSGTNRTCIDKDVYRYDPVYDRYYEYDIDKWINAPPLIARGDNTHDWYMPDTQDHTWIIEGHIPAIGDKKLGMPHTHFFVTFRSAIKEYPVDMVETTWKEIDLEEKYELQLNYFGTILDIRKPNTW